MKFGIDYDSIFKDRLIIITGVGRSGTTILGKILGSMENTYYLFEPAILKYQVYHNRLDLPILFEDYFLPLIQGRNLNFNSRDDSFYKYYYSNNGVNFAWKTIYRRDAALKHIEKHKPFFIIKSPEFQPLAHKLHKIVPSVRYVNILRNYDDTIASIINKGWYADDYNGVDFFDTENIPYFIDENSRRNWKSWDIKKRVSCVWDCLTSCIMPSGTINVSYDELVQQPWRIVNNLSVSLGLNKTITTTRNINSVRSKT